MLNIRSRTNQYYNSQNPEAMLPSHLRPLREEALPLEPALLIGQHAVLHMRLPRNLWTRTEQVRQLGRRQAAIFVLARETRFTDFTKQQYGTGWSYAGQYTNDVISIGYCCG